jgi:precorrin-2/cobalt-factor-2 C20-methyltransferase
MAIAFRGCGGGDWECSHGSISSSGNDSGRSSETRVVADAAIIIKLGRHFAKVRAVLEELDILPRALYIKQATLPNQQIYPLDQANPTTVPDWALIVIFCQRQAH